ncbi:Na(+)/H(+) exchange regulatory cofactor NHE-RF3-like [Branchiostoma floridae]|uniref:Na(+)/H(+) exchange regulatory cofactor NHE-RF3-like n=1 Tax=Branchiostoma floridae TaxID=7739 RepID=A0A9J7KFE8_BRAFL|nr:Na(+)/H(+) exchange regulatory cofactor NHE-RF3-like [Branchiostoma floridae]
MELLRLFPVDVAAESLPSTPQITLEDRVRLKTPSPLSPTCTTPTVCRIEQPRRIHLKPEDKKLVVRSPTDKFYLPIYNFTIESKRNLLEQHVVVKIMSAHVRESGLREGDVILSINGSDVRALSHDDVIALIQRQKNDLRMVVRASPGWLLQQPRAEIEHVTRLAPRGPKTTNVGDYEEHPLGGTLQKMHPFAEPKNVTIKPHLLYRLPETMGEIPVYGISIHSEKGTHHVEELYSKNAKESGLKRGDLILSVGGQNVGGLSREEVVRRIQERCDHLELTVISPHYHWARRFWRSWKKLVQPFRVIFGKSEWMG